MPSGNPVRIAVFASGAGSNTLRIIEYFTGHPHIRVAAIICNNPAAGVLVHAHRHQVPALLITRMLLNDQQWFLAQLRCMQVDRIVLAGFLLLIPPYLVQAYPGRIVNIHPALLPAYGGKGMYGMHVHEAVRAAGEAETGITIHLVNEHYDEGKILFQERVSIDAADTPESIAQKIHVLEHRWYPQVIAQWISGTMS